MRNVIGLIVSILIAQSAGLLGAWANASSVRDWYPTLTKPWFTPPNWLFGPAWITLYTLMSIAAYIVWSHGSAKAVVKIALAAYGVQLLLNAAWSPVFFGLRAPGPGLIVIVLLWIAIVGTLVWFARVSSIAAWLLVPYLAWVTYATALNFELWRLN